MVVAVGIEAAAGVAPPFGGCIPPGDMWPFPGAPIELFGAGGPVSEPWLAATDPGLDGVAGPGGLESPGTGPAVVLLLSTPPPDTGGGRPCGRKC